MGLNKATGDMFEWVSHTWNPIAGECSHKCKYCYVKELLSKPVLKAKYSGVPRLALSEVDTKLGKGNTIFVQNMGDLFALNVPDDVIGKVIQHLEQYPDNTYLLQTKNPGRAMNILYNTGHKNDKNIILGTTIETDDLSYPDEMSLAPSPILRATALRQWGGRRTITIEPIMKFDLEALLELLKIANPTFVSIGADSCGNGLPEPTADEVRALIQALQGRYTIHLKKNLKRILPEAF